MKLCLLSAAPPDADAPGEPWARVAALAARGDVDLTVALVEPPAPGLAIDGLTLAALDDLAGASFTVALAWDWRATVRLFEVEAERHALLVERFEHEVLVAAEADRLLAIVALDLPVDLIAGSPAVADELRELRPEARVLLAPTELDPDAGAAALGAALAEIAATPPPPAALLPRRLMADLDAALLGFRSEYRQTAQAYRLLEQDELVRATAALRAAYRSERLRGVRSAASPLVVRAKRRFGSGESDGAG